MVSESLNVIALISGGKDSFFSLLHCIHNGHRVIALANLYPPAQPTSQFLHSSHSHEAPVEDHLAGVESLDLNSFMYQTVGHSIIPLYSIALALPLYRQPITGTSVQQGQSYDSSSHAKSGAGQTTDETEDLVPLLRQVISAHPEANAVSTGAILSTYQRTRVESIAIRLGLTPLSFLWQYPLLPPPQSNKHRPDSLTGLLEDMPLAGIDARIIKIASAGIPEKYLFASISEKRTQIGLVNGLTPFFEEDDEIGLRGAILGEGGEYETIALSGPKKIWKGGRIEIDATANEPHTEEGVTYFRFGKARVVPHSLAKAAVDTKGTSTSDSSDLVVIPSLLDLQFRRVQTDLHNVDWNIEEIQSYEPSTITASPQQKVGKITHSSSMLSYSNGDSINSVSASVLEQRQISSQPSTQMSYTTTPYTITINNITSSSIKHNTESNSQDTTSPSSVATPPATAATQMQTILNHLTHILSHLSKSLSLHSLATANISSTTLLLQSMTNFTSINPIYSQIYPQGLPNPPARVTIAAPLPQNIEVSLSVTLDICPRERRRGLHVQGRSYWAPANIGPYSQAIAVPLQQTTHHQPNNDESDHELEIVHIAGQIPLVPASMEPHTGPFLNSAILALQHLWRVGQERRVDIWPWSVAYLAQNPEADISVRARIAGAAWRTAHGQPTWESGQEGYSDDSDRNLDEGSDEGEVDVWDLQRNRSLHAGFRRSRVTVGRHLHILPDHVLFKASSGPKQRYIPPFLAAEITALPRNVDIEWFSCGLGGFKRISSSSRPVLEWRSRVYDWGSISYLTITPSSSKRMRFIAYQISILSPIDGLPTTLSRILALVSDGSAMNNKTMIVQSMAFVTSAAQNLDMWACFLAQTQSHESDQTTSSPIHEQTGREPLGAQANVIPCYRLWGQPAVQMPFGRRRHGDERDETVDDEIKELSMAFLLRIEEQLGPS